MTEVTDKLIIESEVKFADQSNAALKGLEGTLKDIAVISDTTEKSTASLEGRFKSLERQFGTVAGQSQKFEKIQRDVNLAVAQNPELQDRANELLAKASERFEHAKGTATGFNAVLESGRGALLGYAAGIGPIGALLGSFGPWGVAAAAGIGLVVNALDYMNKRAAEIGDASSSLQRFADNTGLTITQVRGLNEAGSELGIASYLVGTSLQKFTFNLADARKGGGELYDQLRVIDRQLADDISSTHDGAEALNILAKAYNSTTDATTKAAIARAAFGKGGAAVGGILGTIGDSGGVDQYSSAVQKALGVTDEWTKKVGDLRNENKSLEEDLKLIGANAYSAEMLERQNRFLKTQIEIAKLARDAATLPGGATSQQRNPFVQETNRSAGIEPRTYAQGGDPVVDSAPTDAAKKATDGLAQAQLDNLNATIKMAAASSSLVSALGSAATAAEKEQARIEALTVSFEAGKISAETYGRALNANPAIAAADAATQSLKDQNELAKAGTLEKQKLVAEAQKYRDVLKETGSVATANNAKLAVEESYNIKIKAARETTREADLAWQQDMLGVSDKAIQAANAAQAAAEAWQKANDDAFNAAGGNFGQSGGFGSSSGDSGKQYTSTSNLGYAIIQHYDRVKSASDLANITLGSSGVDAAIAAAQGVGPQSTANKTYGNKDFSAYGFANKISDSDTFGAVQALYELKNAQTTDKSAKIANLQQEMAFFQSQPETIARDQLIVNLQHSIDQLKQSTDANTAATSATLNPLYSQGHGALAIGYYKAAGGLDMVAQGPTSGDQIPFHAMINGGERVRITPAGQGSNDNSRSSSTVQNVYIDQRGVKTSNARRNMRQFAQGLGQVAAAGG